MITQKECREKANEIIFKEHNVDVWGKLINQAVKKGRYTKDIEVKYTHYYNNKKYFDDLIDYFISRGFKISVRTFGSDYTVVIEW